MYKFFGTPLKEILSKTTHKVMFRFDTKGEFITDDPEIIKRALGFFDYIEMKAEPVGGKVAKTHTTPAMVITINGQENKEEKKHCKKCNFTCDNQGELLAHYRDIHPKEGK
jgi:hypothetical protein